MRGAAGTQEQLSPRHLRHGGFLPGVPRAASCMVELAREAAWSCTGSQARQTARAGAPQPWGGLVTLCWHSGGHTQSRGNWASQADEVAAWAEGTECVSVLRDSLRGVRGRGVAVESREKGIPTWNWGQWPGARYGSSLDKGQLSPCCTLLINSP